jgi:ribosomal protein L16 Arg81 hydroxylase
MTARLGLDWEVWAIAQLATGAAAGDVIDALVAEGLARDLASAQIDQIVGTPSFAMLRQRGVRGTMAEQLVRARQELAPVTRIDRCATLDAGEFRDRYWQTSRPVVLTEAARQLRAVERWTFASLAERFGDVAIEVNVRRGEATRGSETERHVETWKLGDFLARAATTAGNDAYIVSRNGLLARPELRALWDDLAPLPAMLAPPDPPRGAALWIGPAGTRSPAHFDPHGVLLVQVQGRKRVRLVAPDHLEMVDALDGYYATRTHSTALEVELAPGEALFVPLAWFHEVTALDPSITLSLLCFRWPNQFHWFEPPG